MRQTRYVNVRDPKRLAAKQAGNSTYDPGVPCGRGHTSHRNVWSNKCLRCHADRQAQRNWDRMGVKATRPRPDACECCGAPDTGPKRLSLDHDHTTGAFRGWLCGACNTAIGSLGDTEAAVKRAVDYLRRSKQ